MNGYVKLSFAAFFSSVKRKKGTEKRETRMGQRGLFTFFNIFLKFFGAAPFLTRKSACFQWVPHKKGLALLDEAFASVSAAHDPISGITKGRLNHQPLNQKDRAAAPCAMDRAPFP